MKKRNKKYNPRKKIQQLTKGFTIESRESWAEGDTQRAEAWIQHPLYGRIEAGTEQFKWAEMNPRKWRLQVFVECLAPDGQGYIEEAEIITDPCRLRDLEGVYPRYREECLAAVNSRHVQDIGWRATTLT